MATRTFGPGEARCEVRTFREGLLSPVAHDLVLEVTAFEIAVDAAAPSVSAVFDAASLRVTAALRGGAPAHLSAADARKIEGITADEVLRARRAGPVRFTSTSVGERDGGYDVRGQLTVGGVTRPAALEVVRKGGRLEAEVRIAQPEFGIRPYSALLGAIRVRPDVLVRVSLPAAAAEPAPA